MELSLLPPQPFKNGQVLCVDISQRKGILIDYSQPRQFLAKFDYMIDKNYAYLTIEVDGERMYICAHINELSECLIDFEEEAA
jgi:hypothetical protein